jgi:drug/metabolite transporter (DMT)-like permease
MTHTAGRAGGAGAFGDLALYGITVLVWGTSWIAIHFQLGTVAPEVSVMWRFVLAAPVMMAWAAFAGERFNWPLRQHGRFALLGATLFSTNFVLFYLAGQHVASGLLAVVFSMASPVTMVLAALLFRQRPEPRVAWGGLAGVAGVALMFGPDIAAHGLDRAALTGLTLAAAGTLVFSCGNMVATGLQRDHVPARVASGFGMAYAAAGLGLHAMLRGLPITLDPTPAYLGSLVYLSLMSSVVAFAAYLELLRRLGAARAAYATVLFPVVALAASTLFENYVWTLPALAGLCLVLAGNALVLLGGRKRPSII